MNEETNKPYSIFIPVDWSKIKRQKTLEKILNESYEYVMEILTEDITHEIIEPKQIKNSVSKSEK